MHDDKKIPLVEMFGPTIQGEGAVIGQQTYFMRFGLCDYKCTMCDSMNAVDPKQVKANAQWLTQAEICDKFTQDLWLADSTRWITLSGGNPCIHDLSGLIQTLRILGFRFAVETQGTKCPRWLSDCSIITVSPKGPGMGENCDITDLDKFMSESEMWMHNVNFKIVLFDQRDLEFARMMWERYHHFGIPFYLSLGNPFPPTIEGNVRDPQGSGEARIDHFGHHVPVLVGNYKMLFEEVKCDPILSNMRFLPQWHVFVWGNEKGK